MVLVFIGYSLSVLKVPLIPMQYIGYT